MADLRPTAPAEIKRRLRQEAGFGCSSCGHPFIEYHHIVPWAEDPHFRPEDMMVLCSNCHHLCTTGALSVPEQRKLKARPKNLVDGLVRGTLYVNAPELVVHLAGGVAIETPGLLVLSGETVLAATMDKADGRVLVSAAIHDQQGQVVAQLVENEWQVPPAAVWDFEVYPRQATVRHRAGDIAFSIDARNDRISLRGKWYHQRQALVFSATEARLGTNVLMGMTVRNCGTMIGVG